MQLHPPRSTDALETEFEAAITGYLSALRLAIARQVLPRVGELLERYAAPRFDDADAGRVQIAGLNLEFLEISRTELEQSLLDFGARVVDFGNESARRQLEAEVPKEKRRRLMALGLDTLEPWMLKRAREWAALNADLIVSLPQDLAQQVDNQIMAAVRDGKRPETLAGELEQWLSVPPSRAQLLARDQVGKLQSDIIAGRQQELGIESYYWMTANDRRVVGRPGGLYPKGSLRHQDHYIRRGRLFVANEGPPLVELVDGKRVVHEDWTDGHPGDGIQCRCWRRPNIDGLLRRL